MILDTPILRPTLQAGYDNSAASPAAQIVLDTTRGAFRVDGASLAVGEEEYFEVMRGGTTVLSTAFDTVAQRTIIKSGGVGGADFEGTAFPDRATIRILLDQLEFLPQDRTLTSAFDKFTLRSQLTLDFASASFSAFVRFGPTIRYLQDANPFGQGLLFNAQGIFENDPSVAADMSTGLSYVAQNRYRANAQTITMFQSLEFLAQPILDVTAGGTYTMTANLMLFTGRGSILTGATLTGDRCVFTADDFSALTGTLTGANVGFDIADLTPGAGGAFGVRSLLTAGATVRFIEHLGTAESNFGGDINLTGAALLNFGTADALGGGAGALLGLIGGTGPTVAAQNTWIRVESGGVVGWVPLWV